LVVNSVDAVVELRQLLFAATSLNPSTLEHC
jgi:hypothetical protein